MAYSYYNKVTKERHIANTLAALSRKIGQKRHKLSYLLTKHDGLVDDDQMLFFESEIVKGNQRVVKHSSTDPFDELLKK